MEIPIFPPPAASSEANAGTAQDVIAIAAAIAKTNFFFIRNLPFFIRSY